MTTSSEDVLLQVGQVRFKKGDGTLYLMSERLAWMLDNKDTVSVSHRYADIKTQKISPEGKPKIQLQVVLHDNSASTFQFVNRQGSQASIKDRDKVKHLLFSLLPKFKKQVDKELEEKNRLLSENPGLLQLYKDLVITQVVTSEEFWAQHASSYINKDDHTKQTIGVSGAFLSDVKLKTDGCNGVRYNMTKDVVEAVFRTYPAVRQKYAETVPNKMTESEFWMKFFQSHYFHRDRINTGTKDVFSDCARIDDQVLSKEMEKGVDDPLVDIGGLEDANVKEIYGLQDKPPPQNIIHQNIIKRFNTHSIMVLKACQTPLSISTQDQPQINGRPQDNGHGDGPSLKKRRIREKITYDDLERDDSTDAFATAQLHLSKVERYLQGPTPGDMEIPSNSYSDIDPRISAMRLKEEAMRWELHCPNHNLILPSTAVSTLGELTPGGALMKAHHDDSLAQLVSESLAKDVRQLYRSSQELLRHFWACFPPTTPELQAKVERMHDAIRRFHSARLIPFEKKVMVEFSPLGQQLTSHLNQLLKTAYAKYDVWQSRKKAMPIGIR